MKSSSIGNVNNSPLLDMLFGVMSTDSDVVHALAVLTGRTEVHGRKLSVGNVVVEIRRILVPGLLPLCSAAFDMDEHVCEGGFYEWPRNRLAIVQIKETIGTNTAICK